MTQIVEEYFVDLPARIDPGKLVGMNVTYQFVLTGDEGGEWVLRIARGRPEIRRGVDDAADITITASASDWQSIIAGTLAGQTAFLTGKLKIQGDISLALKLQSLLPLG
jgi:putative sterol carrier protein